MWTDGQRTKTNPQTSPEQSAIFQLVQEINKTNVLTKFHDDKAKNVTSIVKTAPSHWKPYLYKTNLFTKFHDDWAKHVTSRVKLPPGSHVIQLTGTIFQLNSRIKETNVLTKFHENWAKNVTSRVFTCVHNIHIEKNAPPTGVHVFSPILTIFELVRHINKTNVLNNLHDDWAQIVTSRVFTRFLYSHIMKTAPPTGGHLHKDWALNVTSTVFKLDRDIIGTNLLTKFHEDHVDGQTDDGQRPTDRQADGRTETKVLTKFHENWAKNVTSRVYIQLWISYNNIEKLKGINVLKKLKVDLPNMKELGFVGNPLADSLMEIGQEVYTETITKKLPKLKRLDAQLFSEKTRGIVIPSSPSDVRVVL
ncbi:hypothetical protein DPMN_027708 [Dreissena polymorpha]|uniref:Uncharacterized protein n=1 Tax=Dreissena polymorpha TaxID=45954 RepID=A0A9D4LU08_DREPO|nr:hypothetical protein DPMN_027708 [Dreissena polymorpha]